MQTCICPSGCQCHSLSLASAKSRLVLPFWYRLTRVVPEKGLLNVCVRVCSALEMAGQRNHQRANCSGTLSSPISRTTGPGETWRGCRGSSVQTCSSCVLSLNRTAPNTRSAMLMPPSRNNDPSTPHTTCPPQRRAYT